MRSIYFDYNATTPLDPLVREAMLPCLDRVYGNPSSIHHLGRMAKSLLDDARDRVAAVWRCRPSEIVFTGGGTESNNLAILGTARALGFKGRHLITSAVEHHAVLHPFAYLERHEGFRVTYIQPDAEGRISVPSFLDAVRPDTVFASIMAANNEVGAIQPTAEIGACCRQRGIVFHTDAVQWFGKCSCSSVHELNADLVSICGHKLHGPKGAGALFIRSPLTLWPTQLGGSHESERRAGTENLAAILGLTVAIEQFVHTPAFQSAPLEPLLARLIAALGCLPGVALHHPNPPRLNNTLAFSFSASDSITLLAALDLEGICASGGAACTVGSLQPSHVLLAMGASRDAANSLIRLSLGRHSSSEEVDFFLSVLPTILERVMAMA